MRRTRAGALIVAVLLMVGLTAAPASAAIHEIVAQWCSGHGELEPPGVTGGSNADNFARPLFASKAVQISPYPEGGEGAVLIDFDFDHPALKIAPTGDIVMIDEGLFIEAFVLDTNHGFANCARFPG